MKRRTELLLRTLCCLILGVAPVACGADPAVSSAPAPHEDHEDLLKLFDYDPNAPLDIQAASTEKKEGYTLQELTYASPKGGRVPALLLIPDGQGPFPAVLVMHGAPGSARSIQPEAEALVKLGAVALAISAPFARGERLENPRDIIRFDERDRADQIQLIVDLRRAVDLLLARPDVAGDRIAYAGRSFGGAQGGLLAGVEKRIKAYALVVGDGGLVSHFTGADDTHGPLQMLPPEQVKRWRAAMDPIEPIRWVGHAAPAHLLFQNGRRDDMVPEADGRAYQEAGSEPKTILWYDEGHKLGDKAASDRYTWLAEQIGIRKPAPALRPDGASAGRAGSRATGASSRATGASSRATGASSRAIGASSLAIGASSRATGAGSGARRLGSVAGGVGSRGRVPGSRAGRLGSVPGDPANREGHASSRAWRIGSGAGRAGAATPPPPALPASSRRRASAEWPCRCRAGRSGWRAPRNA